MATDLVVLGASCFVGGMVVMLGLVRLCRRRPRRGEGPREPSRRLGAPR